MYDTAGMRYFTKEAIKWYNLDYAVEKRDTKTGLTKMTGKTENIWIREIENGYKLEGSLPKYYFGNNLEVLSRQTTKQAIEKLSDTLSLKLDNSVLYRIDIGNNFVLNSKVSDYQNCLDELSRFKKWVLDKSLYYSTKKIQLIVYDKIAEMRKKKDYVPEEFKQFAGRVLRYELRYLNSLKNTFGRDICLNDITDEQFYIELIENWKRYYFQITKKNKQVFKETAMIDNKTFQNQLMLIAIKTLGTEEIFKMIELSRGNVERHKIKRIKDKINDILKNKELTMQNPLIEELDKKVKNANLYYR